MMPYRVATDKAFYNNHHKYRGTRVKKLIFMLGFLGFSVAAAAENFMFEDIQDRDIPESQEESIWKATAEFGFLMRSGNTDSKSWKTKLDIARDSAKWRHRGAFTYDRAERNTDTGKAVDTDRIFTSVQSNRVFGQNKNSSLFFYTSYEDDKNTSFDYQSSFALGYGSRFNYSKALFADFEVGPGLAHSKYKEGSSDTDAILRLATNIEWTISENAGFTQLISTEIGEDNTRSRAVSALTANLNSKLAMRLTLTLTHNSVVMANTSGVYPDKLDTETAVTLVYTF